jgi:rubrerythrin
MYCCGVRTKELGDFLFLDYSEKTQRTRIQAKIELAFQALCKGGGWVLTATAHRELHRGNSTWKRKEACCHPLFSAEQSANIQQNPPTRHKRRQTTKPQPQTPTNPTTQSNNRTISRGAIGEKSQLVAQTVLFSQSQSILKELIVMDFKGSQTEKNLLVAFAGESQARNRYTFAASVARKEGFEQISAVFQETADNEKEHAQLFFGHLQGGTVEITAAYPAAKTADTAENLRAAAEGERFEWTMLYPNFGEVAEKEGFKAAANTFRMIAKVEVQHEKRYQKLLQNLQQGTVFKKPAITKWKCRNCGYIHEGAEAPGVCPVCNHPQSYFELQAENY